MRGSSRGAVTLVLLAATFVAVPGPANAQEVGASCAGHPVTIYWQDLPPGTFAISGTNGPDVIQGGPRSEVIRALGGEDVVCGGGGNDIVDGGPGRDELLGQGDSDSFEGADLGQDVVTGGSSEVDTVNYEELSAGVHVDLTSHVVDVVGPGPSGGVLGIEQVKGTAHADVLRGSSRDEYLYGRGGADTVEGRGGGDELGGGPDNDTVTFQGAGAAVTVDLGNGSAMVGSRRLAMHGFEGAVGSRFDDRLVGRDAADGHDHLVGGGGDDVLKGKDGDDVLEGRGGDDVIHPGHGEDFVDGGANDPVTSSGAHGDLISYQGDTLATGEVGFSAWLYQGPVAGPGSEGVGDDDFTGVESLRGVKNRQNLLQGDDGPNVLIGGDGQDYLDGRGGNDLVYGLGGVDSVFGDYASGSGDDYLDAGAPTGPSDGDRVRGNGGDDTCTGALDDGDHINTCETIF